MKKDSWKKFRTSIDPTFKATIPGNQLAKLISNLNIRPLTTGQYAALELMDTDVILAKGKQYTFGHGPSGLVLYPLACPVEPDRPCGSRISTAVPRRGSSFKHPRVNNCIRAILTSDH